MIGQRSRYLPLRHEAVSSSPGNPLPPAFDPGHFSCRRKGLHFFVNRSMSMKTTRLFFKAMLEMSEAHSLRCLSGSTRSAGIRWALVSLILGFPAVGTVPLLLLFRAVRLCWFRPNDRFIWSTYEEPSYITVKNVLRAEKKLYNHRNVCLLVVDQ